MADLILYVILGAVAGIIYGMRKLYVLENKMINLEKLITQNLIKKRVITKQNKKRR